jgi:hypothetical protein
MMNLLIKALNSAQKDGWVSILGLNPKPALA